MTKKIAVIGGGIVGSTAAFYLSKNQQNVTLFDEGTGQATSAAAGIISPWLSQRRNKEWYFLAKEGAKFYQTLMADLSQYEPVHDIYQQTGTILYKKTPNLLSKLTKLATERKVDAPEIGDILPLTEKEVKEIIPNLLLDDDALFVSGGAKIDGAKLVTSLINQLEKMGNTYLNQQVTRISYDNNQWQVHANELIHSFDQLILACGAWVGDLLRPLDFFVDVRPQKGQLIELQTSIDTTNWPVIMPVGETDIIPFDNGKILIGATHENDGGYDLKPDEALLNNLKKQAEASLSTISQEDIHQIRVGTRAYTSDFSPFFGEVQDLDNLYVASGLGSSGLTTGPVIGKTLADWILGEETAFEAYRNKPNQYIYKNQ